MQTISHVNSRKGASSSIIKRAAMVLAVLLLALTVNVTKVTQAESGLLSGALLGGGVGAIFGGRRGAVAGAITGGLLGALSKRKSKKRRW